MSISVVGANKRYGDFAALDDVSIEIPAGSLTSLLGPSGSGKSTLLRAIAGLDDLDSGTIVINGDDVSGASPQKRDIGFVFQHYAAFKHLTVRDNIAFGLKIRKRSKKDIDAKVDELLDIVGLTVFQKRFPAQLSGGQRQRMALARALAVDPDATVTVEVVDPFNHVLFTNYGFYVDEFRDFARELMELFTLGVNRGYTEADIREPAQDVGCRRHLRLRCGEELERLLHRDDRAVDAGAVAARRRQQHPLGAGHRVILKPSARPGNVGRRKTDRGAGHLSILESPH